MLKKILERMYWVFVRRFFLKNKFTGFCAGPRTYVYGNCNFTQHNIVLGDSILYNTSFGEFSYMAGGQISNATVGCFTSIGPNVRIGGFGIHPTNWISTNPIFYSTNPPHLISFSDKNYVEEYKTISIGSDVWIGAGVLILDGIKIGDGAVIGAGSIVTKNVANYEVVAGVPAKHIRFRFNKDEIVALVNTPWWKADIDFYKKHSNLFRDNKVFELIKLLNKNNN